MACGPVDPSRPVVRPDCSHTLLMSHTAQHVRLIDAVVGGLCVCQSVSQGKMRKEETPRPLVVVHCVSSHRTQSGNENAVFAARDAQRAVSLVDRQL